VQTAEQLSIPKRLACEILCRRENEQPVDAECVPRGSWQLRYERYPFWWRETWKCI